MLLGPIISRLFTCSNVEKKKIKKKKRMLALVLSLCVRPSAVWPNVVAPMKSQLGSGKIYSWVENSKNGWKEKKFSLDKTGVGLRGGGSVRSSNE